MELVNPAHELPAHVEVALEQGRYSPGRGPWYCTRILPVHRPVARQALLLSGMTRWAVDHGYTAVADGMMVDNSLLPGLPDPRDLGAYPACMVTRARGQHERHPECVIGGWAAATFHGLPYWADSAPVLLLAPGRSNGSDRTVTAQRKPLQAAVRALPTDFDMERDTVTPDPLYPGLRVVTAPVALAQCLRSVMSGKHTWPVVRVPGLTERQVRAVQLIDAFVQCTSVTWRELEGAASGLVSRRELRRLRSLVAVGAESPRETILRLLVRDLLPAGHVWETQVGVRYQEETGWGGTRNRTTFFDIACRTLRIGLYYDGKHHEGEAQTEKDFEQLQDLRDGQWTVIRVNAKLMANLRKLMGQLGRAVDGAVSTFSAGDAGGTVDGAVA